MQIEKTNNQYEEFLLSPGQLVEDGNLSRFLCSNLKELYCLMAEKKSDPGENIFIGAHPISMNRTNIDNIIKDDFLVCEKTDGIRYFLLILNNGKAFLHGRNLVKSKDNQFKQELQFFSANLKLPVNFNETGAELKIKYIFDGELILDSYENKTLIKFLIFDTIIFEYTRTFGRDYYDRLEASRRFLSFLKMSKRMIKSNQNIAVKYLPLENESHKIKLSLKDFFLKEDCEFLFNDYFNKLPHKQDGLIFTKNQTPYKPGRNDDILKWKDASQQTIDFLLINNQKFNNPKNYEGQFANKILDLYLIGYNKEFNTSERVLFDFMLVDEEKYNFVSQEIEKLQSNSDAAVCGIIAECKFNKNLDNSFLKNIYYASPAKFTEILLKSGIFRQGDSQKYMQVFEENMQYYVSSKFRGGWEIYGWRHDKSDPNAFDTGLSIMNGIRDPIDKQDLISMTRKIPGEHPQKKKKV